VYQADIFCDFAYWIQKNSISGIGSLRNFFVKNLLTRTMPVQARRVNLVQKTLIYDGKFFRPMGPAHIGD